MSSASKTPNLNLPQWVATEKPEMADFNGAFNTIDGNINNLNKSGYLPLLNVSGLDILTSTYNSVTNGQIRWFKTRTTTTNLPANTTHWQYSMGYVFKSATTLAKIVLYSCTTNQIAYNTYNGSAWVGWTIM